MTDMHTCSYYCDRPNCIKRQRDELREALFDLQFDQAQVKRLRYLTPAELNSLGSLADGMDGDGWDMWVQGKFAEVNGLCLDMREDISVAPQPGCCDTHD